jgi:addiction module RelE/StbE family toxin
VLTFDNPDEAIAYVPSSLMTTINTSAPVIKFSTRFNQQLEAAPREIKLAVRETLELFRDDLHYPTLRNHPLHGQYAGYRSIDVTGDWRAISREANVGEQRVITFYFFGTHKQLYGKDNASESQD